MTSATNIHKAAGVIIQDRQFLVTRSTGKDFFIAPGGKLEAGETVLEALAREMREELSIIVDMSTIENLGSFYATAAGDVSRQIQMDVFIIHDFSGEISPSSEVEEIRWINSQTDDISIGSIFQHDIAPLLKQRDLID